MGSRTFEATTIFGDFFALLPIALLVTARFTLPHSSRFPHPIQVRVSVNK